MQIDFNDIDLFFYLNFSFTLQVEFPIGEIRAKMDKNKNIRNRSIYQVMLIYHRK